MAKKIINVNKPNDFINTGSAPNARDGDSLRSSFARLNDAIDNIDANFTEVYALATGGTLNGTLEIDIQGSVVGNDSSVIVNASNSNVNAAKVTAGAIEITGSTISTTDSSTIIIDQATTVTSNLTVGGDVLPSVANGGDLGSSARPWKSLYVSNNTIFIGGVPLGIDANGALTTGGTVVGSTPAWANITGKPTIPTSFSSLVNSSKTVSLGTDSILTLPAPLAQLINASQLATDTAKIYRATNSTDLVAIATAWDNWYSSELMFRELVYQDSVTNPNRPWANKPSWEAYPIITAYMPTGSQLPIPSNLPPTAKAAQDNYLAYKQLVSSIDIVNGNKTISFNNAGLLSLPGKLEFKDTANAKIILKSIDNYGYVIEDPTQDKTWTFNANGSLTFPNATTQTTAWTGSVSSLVNGSHTLSLGSTGNTTFPTGLVLGAPRGPNTVNFTSAIDKEFQIETGTASYSKLWRFETNGNTTLPTGLTFRKNGTPYSTITADLDKVLQIETQTSGGVKQWSFGTDGKLTAPGNLQVDGGKIILNTGGNAYIESVDYGVNSANSAVNIFGGPYQKIKLRAGFGTEAAWTFGTNGALTLPGDLHGATDFLSAALPDLIVIGHTLNITPAPNVSDKKFGFRIDQTGETFDRAFLDMPTAENNKAVSLTFSHANNTIGNIFVQGTDSVTTQLNNAFNIFYNSGDIKVTAQGLGSVLHTWNFANDGDLTIPGDIKSNGNINIDINLSDSTLRRWQFGEDGSLTVPGGITLPNGVVLKGIANEAVALGVGAGAIAQNQYTVSIGSMAGNNTQSAGSIAIGSSAGRVTQGVSSIAIGTGAGQTNQSTTAVAIGTYAGQTNQHAETIILNATGSALNSSSAIGFYVAPIKNQSGTSGVLQYSAGTKEITYSSDITVGNIRSEGAINIDINLSDSTLRRWQFGEDGDLTLPEDAVVKTTSGHLTIKGQEYVFIDSATNGQIEIGRNSGVGAVSLGNKSRGTNVIVDDLFVANGVYEFFSSLADATGVVTHNCANGHLFYHTSPDANWTVNLTNLLDTWNRATSVTLIIAQGATGYIPNAVQIAGVAQTINWQGNATPTPSTNRTDVVTFSIINNSGTYIVLGQLTGF